MVKTSGHNFKNRLASATVSITSIDYLVVVLNHEILHTLLLEISTFVLFVNLF